MGKGSDTVSRIRILCGFFKGCEDKCFGWMRWKGLEYIAIIRSKFIACQKREAYIFFSYISFFFLFYFLG